MNSTQTEKIEPALQFFEFQSFSKASLLELNELESGGKKVSPVDRISSENSLNTSTPPHIKRLQALRERLLAEDDNWNYESKRPMSTILSPLCSPNLHFHHESHDVHPKQLHKELHFHDFDSYPFDHIHNTQPIIHIHEVHSPMQNSNYLPSPSKQMNGFFSEFKSNCKTKNCEEKLLTAKKKDRRAKSCPKDLFSPSSMDDKKQTECIEMDYSQEFTSRYSNESNASPTTLSRQQNVSAKSDGKMKSKPKSKTPNSLDEFLSSKLVRSNLAASLRHKNSRKKINQLAEEKLKESMDVSKFIPKCHHWNVRDTSAWKTFTSEE